MNQQHFRTQVDKICSSLVKQELQSAIRKRRMSKGLPCVYLEYQQPMSNLEFSEEEDARRRARRERNRIAAEKCRRKRREREVRIHQEHKTQEHLNQELKSIIEELEKEKKLLTEVLQTHTNCKLRPGS
ncbi:cyclic AMP-dependent transcription factor ATF-3-like isoform X1 [Ptychodera flava]